MTVLDKVIAEQVKAELSGENHVSEYLTAEDLTVLRDALDLQTKKPVFQIVDKYGKKHDVCPNCHHWIEDCYGYTHCNRCGQRVSFSSTHNG